MKIIIPPLLCLITSGALAALTINCPSQNECATASPGSATFGNEDAQWCCKTKTADVSTCTCPDGWSCSNGSTCTRSSTTTSDTYGYYTQTYGTCEATITTEKKDCWMASQTNTGGCVQRVQKGSRL